MRGAKARVREVRDGGSPVRASVLLLLLACSAGAQRSGPVIVISFQAGGRVRRQSHLHSSDLRLEPARLRVRRRGWSHDYPAADKNLSAIIDYITHIRVRLDGTNVLDLDDPEIFQNPVLYVWEPGFWTIQPSEAKQLREYLLKGGIRHLRRLRGA